MTATTTTIVTDCPRCAAKKITFDVLKGIIGKRIDGALSIEAFCRCRHCSLSSVFLLKDKTGLGLIGIGRGIEELGSSISMWSVERYVSQRDKVGEAPPSHLPPKIHQIFQEATTCMSVGCFNAAGTMFRLALDVATKSMLPAEDILGINSKICRNLGLRLPWLFDTQLLPEILRELASSVKEDGNDWRT